MSRIVQSARQARVPFPGDGVRKVGCDTMARRGAANRHFTIEAITTLNPLPRSAHRQDCGNTSQIRKATMWQRREYHQLFQNPPSTIANTQLQIRHFVFDRRKARKAKKQKDPFKILKIPKTSLYKDVKIKFLKIAMANHPDMHSEGLSEKEQEAMREKFIEARMAFERLQEDPQDGTAILKEELIDRESNFDSWFKNETGLKNPFDVDLSPETMKEVAEMTEKMGGQQGMERDGGMWALARMVTSAVKTGGDASSILRLESGDVKQRQGSTPGGALRRPRRR